MAKVIVFQHVPREPLGNLDLMLRNRGHRIRYINFHRYPDIRPDITRYDALIILGGPQMPDEGEKHPHLKEEMRCIEDALERDIPVLGLCLGAQLLAYTLGGGVRKLDEGEIGWYELKPTAHSAADPLFCALLEPHPVFQWHGYTFDLPEGAVHLARSESCENQAFRYGHCAYGLQGHLELDERLINQWLSLPDFVADLEANSRPEDVADVRKQTHKLIGQSADLGFEIFGQFLRPLGERRARHILPSR
jgi:GMP synthase (glutamine-hydrolysing)